MSPCRARLFAMGVILVPTIVLAWVVVNGVASHPGTNLPSDTSYMPLGGTPSALVDAAAAEVTKGEDTINWESVGRATKAALAVNPFDERALALFGLSLEASGKSKAAREAMTQAANRSLRTPLPHLWLYNQLLYEGQFSRAFWHADVILRSRPEFRQIVFQSFREISENPVAIDQLVSELEKKPPWRSLFLVWIAKDPAFVDRAAALTVKLQQGRTPPSDYELAPLLNQLVSLKDYDQAFFLWLRTLPNDKFANLDYLFNGNFDFPITGLPFDWSFTSTPGAEISVESNSGADNALHIQFYAGRVPFHGVRKLLVLPPGRYSLQGRENAVDLDTRRGLVWKVICADASSEPLAQTGSLNGTVGWRRFEVALQVPWGDRCSAQWLTLELDARVTLDNEVGGGGVWYDDLSVIRLGREAPN